MSIFLKFDGKIHKNISRPWCLDIGNILCTHKSGELHKVKKVYKTDSAGNMHYIWPNHDKFRFGLVKVVDMTPGHGVYNNANFDTIESMTPLDESTFYPNYPYPEYDKKKNVAYYTVYTDPCECDIRFYIRSCNYRFTKRYLFDSDSEGKTNALITGNWLSNPRFSFKAEDDYEDIVPDEFVGGPKVPGCEEPWPHPANHEVWADGTLTVHQDANYSLTEERYGQIIINQYNQTHDYYTGKSIVINIVQLRDRYVYSKQQYQLTWYADRDCTVSMGNNVSYPTMGPAGGTLNTYFDIKGPCTRWTGVVDEIYFMQWDYLRESVNDVNPYISGDGPYITGKSYNGLGRFSTTIVFPSNEPDMSKAGDVGMSEPEYLPSNQIAPDEVIGNARFQISNTVTTNNINAVEYVELNYTGFGGGVGYANDPNWHPWPVGANLSQQGASNSEVVSGKYIEIKDGEITNLEAGNFDPASKIESVDLSLDGEWVYVTLTVTGPNTATPTYNFDYGPEIQNGNISDTGGSAYLVFGIGRTSATQESLDYTFTVTGKGGGTFDGKDLSQNFLFTHSSSSGGTGGVTQIDGSASLVEPIEGASVGGIAVYDASRHLFAVEIRLPSNAPTESYSLSGGEHYTQGGSGFIPYGGKLPKEANGGNFYVKCVIQANPTSSSDRSTSVRLIINKCEETTLSPPLTYEGSVSQSGKSNPGSGNGVTGQGAGFRITNETDGNAYNGGGVTDAGNGSYYIQIGFAANTKVSSGDSNKTLSNVSINVTKQSDAVDSEGRGIVRWTITATETTGGEERTINYTITHDYFPGTTIADSWTQEAGDGSGKTITIKPTDVRAGDVSISVAENDYAKPVSWEPDNSDNDFGILVSGTNLKVAGEEIHFSGKLGDGDLIECTGTSLDLTTSNISNGGGTVNLFATGETKSKAESDTNSLGVDVNVTIKYSTAEVTALARIPYKGNSTGTPTQKQISWNFRDYNNAKFSEVTHIMTGNPQSDSVTCTISANTLTEELTITASASYGDKTINYTIIQQKGDRSNYEFGIDDGTGKYVTEITWHVHENITSPASRSFGISSKYINEPLKWYIKSSNLPSCITAGSSGNSVNVNVSKIGSTGYSTGRYSIALAQYESNDSITESGFTATIFIELPNWDPNVQPNK